MRREQLDNKRLGGKFRNGRDRVITEFFRWLPAVVFTGIYAASGDFLFLTYAIAFTLWPNLKSLRSP